MKSSARNLVTAGDVLVGIVVGLGLFSLFLSCSRPRDKSEALPPPTTVASKQESLFSLTAD